VNSGCTAKTGVKKLKKKHISPAMQLILLLGIVSLFSDMTHDGAASIRGAYLDLLGASAAAIGFVSGLGELIGYSLRYVFGRIADKTKKYWFMTILGYAIDLIAVPALALVGENGWKWACVLLVMERMGKAIKKPAKSTILSFAASSEGAGKSFAIQEALDQIGAFLGPLLLFLVMKLKQGTKHEIYATCFAVLGIPALLVLIILLYTKHRFPAPENFEPDPENEESFKFKPSFIMYIAGISLFAFGFIDFSLITMHMSKTSLFTESELPLLYAAAMLVDAFSALAFGKMYDKKGFAALTVSTAISSLFAVFVFNFSSRPWVILGICLWGIGMGAQESILKAAIVGMVPKTARGAGYGVFEFFFGLSWFLGSWALGAMYDISLLRLTIVSFAAQALAIPMFMLSSKARAKEDDKIS
jgi:MFS family permease